MPLLVRARELWRELERESGRPLLTLNGAPMIGSADSESMINVLVSAEWFDLPHQVLDAEEMARRYPQYRMLPGEIAFLDQRAGVLRPEFAVPTAARCAEARGARLMSGLVMTWYPALDVAAYQPDRFPIFIRESCDESGAMHIFGIPALDGGAVKVAPHASYGDLADADDLDHNVAPGELAPINRAVAELLPGLVPTPVRVSTYLDAYTSDGHALVGRLPGAENVWLLGAFSGHGFKMATAFGQVAADLVTEGKTDLPIEHLDPARFSTR